MVAQELDFFTLARPVQERFLASTRAQAVPSPIALRRHEASHALPWFAASAACALLLLLILAIGFGDLESSLALIGVEGLLGAIAVAAFGSLCLLQGLVRRQRTLSLPFHAGDYLFPAGVVEARTSLLKLHSLGELADAIVQGTRLVLTFRSGYRCEFTARSESEATSALNLVLDAKQSLEQAEASHNRRDLAALDPLRDNGFSNPFSPTVPFRRYVPLWARLWLPLGLLLGAIAGGVLWKARNLFSEERLFAEAKAHNDIQAYQKYLDRGGARAIVTDVLLPRAELGVAVAQGSAGAIEQYLASHPGSKIQNEVDVALRSALLTELERAKQQGTLAAIRELSAKHPSIEVIAKEVANAEHEFYVRALENLRSKAAEVTAKSDPSAFLQRLIAYVEKNGPTVVVRWRRALRESARRADIQVRLSAYYMGQESVPSQYFSPERARQREAAAAETLIPALQQHFPPEVVRFESGEHFDDPGQKMSDTDAPLPGTNEPTLFITHSVEMTGGYMNPKPRGIFIGAGLLFHAVFQIPGDSEPFEFKLSMWRPPDLKEIRQHQLSPEAVYEKMASESFSAFVAKLQAALFRE